MLFEKIIFICFILTIVVKYCVHKQWKQLLTMKKDDSKSFFKKNKNKNKNKNIKKFENKFKYSFFLLLRDEYVLK